LQFPALAFGRRSWTIRTVPKRSWCRGHQIDSQSLPSPDTVLALGDPGDETARRYRYQWTWAAIGCCTLLDATSNICEVFCEHHEDVLFRRNDGKFVGLQIKTKLDSLEPWKAGDDAVKKALARFCRLDALFPGQFISFRFLTNHVLHTAGTSQDVCHILDQIKTSGRLDRLSPAVRRYLTSISKMAGCHEEIAFSALCKVGASDSLPKLADIETRLIDTLSENWSRASELTYPVLRRAVKKLIQECTSASSLGHEDVLPGYLPAMPDSTEESLRQRIAGKRFDINRLLATLEDGVNQMALLEEDPSSLTAPGVGDGDLLLKKLDAGGFSVVSRNSAVDLRGKAEYLGLIWTNKLGHRAGLQRYSHVRSLVLSDAATAFERARPTREGPIGVPMLSALRERFQQRRSAGESVFECTSEHLEGLAYSLTAECKVQWSTDRPWEIE